LLAVDWVSGVSPSVALSTFSSFLTLVLSSASSVCFSTLTLSSISFPFFSTLTSALSSFVCCAVSVSFIVNHFSGRNKNQSAPTISIPINKAPMPQPVLGGGTTILSSSSSSSLRFMSFHAIFSSGSGSVSHAWSNCSSY